MGVGVVLTGCAYLEQQPEVNPDRFAPAGVDRPWIAAPSGRQDYAVPAAIRPLSLTAEDQAQPNHSYDLAQLIDVALHHNPATRQAWESARAAAAAFGSARAPYYPQAGFQSDGGYTKFQFQDEFNEIVIKQWQYDPALQLTYTLLDFGRRGAAAEAARQQLAAANFTFNRRMQDVVFATQRAFYALAAAKAAVAAARQNQQLAQTDIEAVDQRMQLGLATQPALLLARQRGAQAGYDLENAGLLIRDAQAGLAVALGSAPDRTLDVESLDRQPLPADLGGNVEQLIDRAVKQRPDLAAQVAALRQRQAELRGAQAAWYPTIGVSATYGENLWNYNWNGLPVVNTGIPDYSALLTMRWDLFTGLRRLNDIRQASALDEAAAAQIQAGAIDTSAQVWRAYFQFKTAQKKYQYAQSIMAASSEAYQANFESYRQGLSTIVELLSAANDLATARYTLIQSKADVLTASAAVAYACGGVEMQSK